jgi:addiction module HigA family antidote
MRRLPKNRRPIHPGEVFLEDFLFPLGVRQRDAAERLRVSYPRLDEIVNGKRTVTPDTALRFGKVHWDGAGVLAEPPAGR